VFLRLLDNQPALLLGEDVRTLVVADLHLGFEEELRGKGIRVPLQSHRLVDELCALGRGTNARRLVVVGDFKHNVTGPSTLETELIPRQLRRMKEVFEDIVIIPGNHDGRLEDVVKDFASVAPARGLVLEEEVGLTHGHVKPDESLLKTRFLVTGHLHPVLRIGSGESGLRVRVWLRMRGERRKLYRALYGGGWSGPAGKITLLIMPSFNNALQGRSITDLAMSRLVRGPILNSGAFNLEAADVISLDGTVLGSLGGLRELV
jgi:putative SbcD/Mre11-related phosphoesterase